MNVEIKSFFDPDTATFSYVVFEPETHKAAIIDSVLNYDQNSGRVSTHSADTIITYVDKHDLIVQWVLDTHIHADHLTASHYMKEKRGGKIGIGSNIIKVLDYWVPIFNSFNDTPLDGSQFDVLFEDNGTIKLGNTDIKIIHTPGHTPACSSYIIEDNIFVGDTIFMPDVGTGRVDFPGGSAEVMYDSIQKILSLPEDTKIYLCHDYPPENRKPCCLTSVRDQKEKNILINQTVGKQEYIQKRNKRDEGKLVPRLLLPSIQTNLRTGSLGNQENNGLYYFKIPINQF